MLPQWGESHALSQIMNVFNVTDNFLGLFRKGWDTSGIGKHQVISKNVIKLNKIK